MPDKSILHMITLLKLMSPFDVNMATDAGYDMIAVYTSVELKDVQGLVQDAIFSRNPKLSARTGVFFGGRDAIVALDMIDTAKKSLVPPFELSIFADPAGLFTTAAAMVACVEKILKEKKNRTLSGMSVAVFGATGVVGFSAAVIAALQGAKVTLVGYDGPDRVVHSSREIKARFGVDTAAADGSSEEEEGGHSGQDRDCAVLRPRRHSGAEPGADRQVQVAAGGGRCQCRAAARRGRARPPCRRRSGQRHQCSGDRPAGRRQCEVPDRVRALPQDDRGPPVCFDFRDAFELARTLAK